MGTEKLNKDQIAPVRQKFEKIAPLFVKMSDFREKSPLIPLIQDNRINHVTESAFRVYQKNWLADEKNKKRIPKDYLPNEKVIQRILDVGGIGWHVNQLLTILIHSGEINEEFQSEQVQKLEGWKKTFHQTLESHIEVLYEIHKMKYTNPEIEQIERAKISIENARKANDKRAFMELKLQYGALLSKEHLYTRRLSVIQNGYHETESKMMEAYWNLQILFHSLLDQYTQFLFVTLQSLSSSTHATHSAMGIMNLVTENEEIQKQACILHDRAKNPSPTLPNRIQLLRDITGNMSMILQQQISMKESMQKNILDLLQISPLA